MRFDHVIISPNFYDFGSQKAADIVSAADALVIATGAGMGVASGLPDFRGNSGFWKAYPGLRKSQLDFTSVASPRAFRETPRIAWGFYGHRLNLYRQTTPNEEYGVLKKWADKKPLGAWIFTSNVDGQFQKAGYNTALIRECHGSIHFLQCLERCTEAIWPADDFHPEVDEDKCELLNVMPTCPQCGGIARPNILMFNDDGWISHRHEVQRAREDVWMGQVDQRAATVALIEIGAGTKIPSVRLFGSRLMRERGARLIRINSREPDVQSTRDVGLCDVGFINWIDKELSSRAFQGLPASTSDLMTRLQTW
jgi:NAD-dependent SIR2 family protein deacetylase